MHISMNFSLSMNQFEDFIPLGYLKTEPNAAGECMYFIC